MIEFLKELIVEAGQICLSDQTHLTAETLEFKSKKDLVTQVDKKVEQFIIKNIKASYPGHGILGEETGEFVTDSDYRWIIDPIDGTTSFFHQHPFYCISIAVHKKDQPVLAAVYAPALKELFVADPEGATLNNTPIRVSKTAELVESVMATGFACLRSNLKKNNLPLFNKIVPQLRDIRRFGSSALDLCYVACGRLDGFWEMNLNLYDIAAGAYMVKQASGKICDFNGNQNFPAQGIIAANPYIFDKLLQNF